MYLDEIIESASQVSGPRKIEPYEPQTSRNDGGKIGEKNTQNIIEWVLKDKLTNKFRTAELKPELSIFGSKAVKKEDPPRMNPRNTNATSDRKKSNGSNISNRNENHDSSNQRWIIGSQSSLSDFSKS